MEVTRLKHNAETIDKVIDEHRITKEIDIWVPEDYTNWVIPLVPINEGEYRYCIGEVLIVRDNFIYTPTRVILNMYKLWSQEVCSCSNNQVICNDPNNCSLSTFSYKGIKYYGIKWYGAAHPTRCIFNMLLYNTELSIIPYYHQLSHDILNREIHDSIVEINWDGSSKH